MQGNPISLVDPFGMSPENGKNAIGHTLLDFMGLIPGIGFVFDAANSAWYVAEGNYTMAALVAFAAIPGLGDAVSAGILATKGAKAAELCKIIKKLGYAAKIAENVGEIAINATNMYVDYAIKEKKFGVDTVANLLALGLNGFGIYASVKRYNSVSVDVGKVTDGVEGGNKVAEKVSESGTATINPNDIRFSQSSVNGASEIIDSMKAKGWDGDPIDVVRMPDGNLTTIDNIRVLAARYAEIDVQANVHAFDEVLPQDLDLIERLTTPKGVPQTWGDAVLLRIGKQNSGYRNTYPLGSNIIGWSGN